ncbi:MAG: hypothetical protein QXU09_02160 [Thermoproteota archaeon]
MEKKIVVLLVVGIVSGTILGVTLSTALQIGEPMLILFGITLMSLPIPLILLRTKKKVPEGLQSITSSMAAQILEMAIRRRRVFESE